MQSSNQRPTSACAFLFDGSFEGLPDPQLAYFTSEVLAALGAADPLGGTRSQFRVGVPTLSGFAERTTGVHGFKDGSGRTVSHDKDIYKYVIWEWLDSLGEIWNSIDRHSGLDIFRLHTGECIALSALDVDVRNAIDAILRAVPGYVGAFVIDPGNPVHRGGFFDNLIYAAAIEDGTIVQELSYEGEQDWPLEGSAAFKPGGQVWQPYGWLASSGPDGLPRGSVSERGKKAAEGVESKQAGNVEQRILEEMSRAFFLNAGCKTFEFKAVAESSNILQAVMPEGKFTKYLFDRTSKDGKSKAAFLIDDLGIDPEDWRYLAAQFYSGLLIAQPNSVKLNEWKTGYGVRFEVPMRIRNRAGKAAVLVTGWNMNPGALPSLSTAFPGPRDVEAVEPGEPPILPPGTRGDAEWSQLWAWANADGVRASESHVPTPMFLSRIAAIPEGECGTALVRVFDARRGFARWLKRQGLGDTDGSGGVVAFSPIPSQSIERAYAWARTVASILRLNGIEADTQSFNN
ncbi:MAG: hypothetical protein O9308_07505 [Beijerinckiaceae bacterium]|nr:hypothetical protein [Beijerinckiaceae bacterium]